MENSGGGILAPMIMLGVMLLVVASMWRIFTMA